MSQWDKLLKRITSLAPDIRFEELKKVVEQEAEDEENDR